MDILAKKVVDSVITRYSSLNSYIDLAVEESTFELDTDNEWSSKTLLRTIFKKPNLFRFDRRIGTKAMPDTSIVVWFDGHRGYVCSEKEKPQNASSIFSAFLSPEQILEDCLTRCGIFSGSVNELIHPLFFKHAHDLCTFRRDTWISSISKDQYYLRSSRNGVFVDRDSCLIHKIEDLNPLPGMRSSTVFHTHSIDKSIDDKYFDKRAIERDAMNDRILIEAREEIGSLYKLG